MPSSQSQYCRSLEYDDSKKKNPRNSIPSVTGHLVVYLSPAFPFRSDRLIHAQPVKKIIIIQLVGTFNRKGWPRPRRLKEPVKIAIIKGRNFRDFGNWLLSRGSSVHCQQENSCTGVFSLLLFLVFDSVELIRTLTETIMKTFKDFKRKNDQCRKLNLLYSWTIMPWPPRQLVVFSTILISYLATHTNRLNFFTRTSPCSFSGQTLSSFTVYAK